MGGEGGAAAGSRRRDCAGRPGAPSYDLHTTWGTEFGAARQRALAKSAPSLASVIICCRNRVTVLSSIIGDGPITEQPPGVGGGIGEADVRYFYSLVTRGAISTITQIIRSTARPTTNNDDQLLLREPRRTGEEGGEQRRRHHGGEERQSPSARAQQAKKQQPHIEEKKREQEKKTTRGEERRDA